MSNAVMQEEVLQKRPLVLDPVMAADKKNRILRPHLVSFLLHILYQAKANQERTAFTAKSHQRFCSRL